MNANDIKELILTIDKTSIEKVEIEKSDIKIMITKKAVSEVSNAVNPAIHDLEEKSIGTKTINVSNEDFTSKTNNEDHNKSAVNDENIYTVKSPIVGTFYKAPSPDAPDFAKLGDKVEKGQTLCIIEAMKIMNEIESEVAGEVVEILVNDEDIVEYGQPLMRIRR